MYAARITGIPFGTHISVPLKLPSHNEVPYLVLSQIVPTAAAVPKQNAKRSADSCTLTRRSPACPLAVI